MRKQENALRERENVHKWRPDKQVRRATMMIMMGRGSSAKTGCSREERGVF
jgi:hypothetical protein